MATATKRNSVKATSTDCTDEDKQAAAAQLTKEMRGRLEIKYHPTTFNCFGDWKDEESVGTVFSYTDNPEGEEYCLNSEWFECTNSDVRGALVKALKEHAQRLVRYADKIKSKGGAAQ